MWDRTICWRYKRRVCKHIWLNTTQQTSNQSPIRATWQDDGRWSNHHCHPVPLICPVKYKFDLPHSSLRLNMHKVSNTKIRRIATNQNRNQSHAIPYPRTLSRRHRTQNRLVCCMATGGDSGQLHGLNFVISRILGSLSAWFALGVVWFPTQKLTARPMTSHTHPTSSKSISEDFQVAITPVCSVHAVASWPLSTRTTIP
jgi:hypothetical protein